MDLEEAVRPWINSGLLDLYLAFSHIRLADREVFFLKQGLEKIGKAYLIACQFNRFQHLNLDRASEEVEKLARSYGHDMSAVIGAVCVGIPALGSRLLDREFLGLLNAGNEEGRYPRPPQKTVIGKGVVPEPETSQKAFEISREIVAEIIKRFEINYPLDRPIDVKIPRGDWTRFLRTFLPERPASVRSGAVRIGLLTSATSLGDGL